MWGPRVMESPCAYGQCVPAGETGDHVEKQAQSYKILMEALKGNPLGEECEEILRYVWGKKDSEDCSAKLCSSV